jgi:translation initiation factor 2 alpha subunit (eIF-2alpha)
MSKTLIRFYENALPEKDDIVWGRVTKMDDMGIEVNLLEYNGLIAFLNYRDASRKKKLVKIKQEIKHNNEYTFTVISVEPGKNYIELSKRYQDKKEDEEFINFFKNYKCCMSILTSYFWKAKLETLESQEDFMLRSYWKHDPDELYEKLKDIQIDKITCKEYFGLNETETDMLELSIKGYLKESTCDMIGELKIFSYHPEGVKKIAEALISFEQLLDTAVTLKTPPIYEFRLKNIKERDWDAKCERLRDIIGTADVKDIVFQVNDFKKVGI